MTESLTRWQGKKLAWIYHPLFPTGTFKTFLSVQLKQQKTYYCALLPGERERERVVWLISVTTDILKYIFGIDSYE